MKKIVPKLLALLPVPLLMILINYSIDPAHLFDNGRFERETANELLQGKNLVGVTNYDGRLLNKYYISGLKYKKDVVIIGSSRSLTITKDLFPNKKFFNNSIQGSSLDDIIYMYQIYKEWHLIPKEIIIGLDPWILNKNKYSGSQNTNSTFLTSIHIFLNSKVNINSDEMLKYYQLISPSYFQRSFSELIKGNSHQIFGSRYSVVDDASNPNITKYSDGSMNYRLIFGDDQQKVRIVAQKYDPVPLLGGFDRLDDKEVARFESFVGEMLQDGINVIFYLPPYHPVTYRSLMSSDQFKIIKTVQEYFEEFAKNRGIQVYGSYNPDDYHLMDSDFYDGTHPKESAALKIFN